MSKGKTIATIPARMASTRFPGKPLIDICGLTMIEHVWQRVRSNSKISSVYLVTCDQEIKNIAENFGAKVIMTSNKHTRCTDRVAEGCLKLLEEGDVFDVVLNIQGDEPLLNPETLDLLMEPFCEEKSVSVVNLIEGLETEEEISNPNNVKVVFDKNNFALYISRLPIPPGLTNKHYKQLGAYAFSREAIIKYSEMDESPLEIAESVDMLRFMENGIPVKVVVSSHRTNGVDTPADHNKVCKLMENDEIFKKYKNLAGVVG
ncbi:3-deoxy-manno-octulosonate cytidylyltransferase [Candidatus Margulisiibacteriota bacterium]